MLRAGEKLLRIDPTEYELAVARLESDIQQAHAQLAEVESKSANYDASLKIEKASLALAEKDLDRVRSLQQRNAASAADVDAKEREVLTQRQSVQNLENSINLVPAEKKSLQAAIAVKQTSLKQAKIDLEKTTITVPFDCRLGELSIEVGQFLTTGETLFEALGTAVIEIDAQIAPHEAQTLIDSDTASLPEVITTEAIRERASQLGVTIRRRSGDVSAEWEGRFERLRESLDTQTRMLGIVVAVDKPYEKVIPGRRPPLLRGTFCEVELRGVVREGRLVIPRSSLHDGHVYVLDGEERLRRRPVEIDFAQANFVCLRSGLHSGDTVVVSDPTPAIEGMLVDPVEDVELLETLFREASGEGASE
jgi:RND family efflux transporter MFP subunit